MDNQESQELLFVSTAKVDITPEMGTQISGDIGRRRPVEEIKNPLFARIIVMRSSEEPPVCVITCDMASIGQKHSTVLRQEIAQILNTSTESVMIHCVQCHSAARIGRLVEDKNNLLGPDLWWATGETPSYNVLFRENILNGVKQASENFRPATLKAARGMDGRNSFNRRFVMRDGTGKTHPARCSEEILYCEGTIDPEVSIFVFEDKETSKPIAAFLHHTCHPTHGYPHKFICADWPGLWSEQVSQMLGNDCVTACINGACGNISPVDHINPEPFDQRINLAKMVKELNETTEKLIENLKPINSLPLKSQSSCMTIPWKHQSDETVSAAQKLISEHKKPIFTDENQSSISWDWIFAVKALDLVEELKESPNCSYEVQNFRIGDLTISGWPGEPFVEAQLDVKLNSPAPYSIVGHLCNATNGYQPTLGAYKNGGYETVWTKLPPGTLEKVAEFTIKQLNQLF
jgi:hypothetical protein